MKKGLVLFLSFIIIALVGFLGYRFFTNRNNIQYVAISINPDIELAVNSDNEVIEVIPVNEDADIMLTDVDLVGLDVEEASAKVIDSAIDMGYIDEYSDENAVMIATYGDNDSRRADLEKKVIDKLNNHFETRKIYAVLAAKGLSDELKQEADNYGISYGKMLLVERAISLNSDLKKEELVDKSVREVQKEIKTYVSERHDALKTTISEARETWKQEKEKIKSEYRTKIEDLKTDLWEENKDEHKNLTPEQKKEVIKTLLEERKAELKANLDEIKEEIKETTDQYNYPIIENNVDSIRERIQDRKNR